MAAASGRGVRGTAGEAGRSRRVIGQRPHVDRLVQTGGEQRLGIGRKGHRQDGSGVAGDVDAQLGTLRGHRLRTAAHCGNQHDAQQSSHTRHNGDPGVRSALRNLRIAPAVHAVFLCGAPTGDCIRRAGS